MARRLSDAERRFILEHFEQLGPQECARRVGCSRQTVSRVWKESGEASQKPATNRHGGYEPQSDLERLVEVRGMLRRAMADAPPNTLAALSKEYRETCRCITQMEGGDRNDPTTNAVNDILDSIASRVPTA